MTPGARRSQVCVDLARALAAFRAFSPRLVFVENLPQASPVLGHGGWAFRGGLRCTEGGSHSANAHVNGQWSDSRETKRALGVEVSR